MKSFTKKLQLEEKSKVGKWDYYSSQQCSGRFEYSACLIPLAKKQP